MLQLFDWYLISWYLFSWLIEIWIIDWLIFDWLIDYWFLIGWLIDRYLIYFCLIDWNLMNWSIDWQIVCEWELYQRVRVLSLRSIFSNSLTGRVYSFIHSFILSSVSDPYQETLIWIRVATKINQTHGINKSKWFVNVLFTWRKFFKTIFNNLMFT